MTKMDIIAELAEDRTVERMVLGYVHRYELTYDLQDLCQLIYVALMGKPAREIQRMYHAKELTNYIGGIIRHQVNSTSSEYYYTIIRPQKTDDITDNDPNDND